MIFRVIFSILSFISGSLFAGFAVGLSRRVANGESMVGPAHCPFCGRKLKWYENIPILSYVVFRGKCKSCKAPVGAFGFVCELLGGLGFLALYLVFGLGYHLAFGFVIGLLFLIISGIDWLTNDVYDITIILFALLAVGFTLCDGLYHSYIPYNRFIGAAVGFAAFFLIKVVAKKIYKREALGSGDVFIVTVGGLLLGYINLIFSLAVASVSALCAEVPLMIVGKGRKGDYIPFAPYLCLGFFIAYTFGDLFLAVIT